MAAKTPRAKKAADSTEDVSANGATDTQAAESGSTQDEHDMTHETTADAVDDSSPELGAAETADAVAAPVAEKPKRVRKKAAPKTVDQIVEAAAELPEPTELPADDLPVVADAHADEPAPRSMADLVDRDGHAELPDVEVRVADAPAIAATGRDDGMRTRAARPSSISA
jgi:hypothetical protein